MGLKDRSTHAHIIKKLSNSDEPIRLSDIESLENIDKWKAEDYLTDLESEEILKDIDDNDGYTLNRDVAEQKYGDILDYLGWEK